MPTDTELAELTHTIQLAVAPVFLLTALGTILSVLSARLGRIVDRARALSAPTPPLDCEDPQELAIERRSLAKRRHLVNQAITFATSAALLVCLLIVFAFLGFLLHVKLPLLIAALFILAMSSFIAALVCFLREVLMAVARPGPGGGAAK